jgi:two-component system, sensor histidine kinase
MGASPFFAQLRPGMVALRNFFWHASLSLLPQQRTVLRRQLLEILARRSGYWAAILLFSSILVFRFGTEDPTHRHGLSLAGWGIILWILIIIPYAYLLHAAVSLPADPSPRTIRLLHILWGGWLTIIAFWWFLGNLVLIIQPPPGSPQQFMLTQQAFIRLTILAHVFSVLLISSSVLSLYCVLGIGFLVPYLFGLPHLSAAKLEFRNAEFVTRWFMSYLVTYSIIGWAMFQDIRHILTRSIISDAERARAEAERSRAQEERARANLFVSAISHDLRQPLTSLALQLGSLRRRTDLPELQGKVRELETQTKALEYMIDGALDVSMIEAGTWKVEIREVALPLLIDTVAQDLESEAASKNIRLECRSVPYLVRTDPRALERILKNLIGNAIRYTPEVAADGATGCISVECVPRGDVMCISVADNGIGIPQDKFEDIFKEYVQLKNTERDRTKGLGLGLSIVKGLAALLGHKLELDSSVGKGSRFAVLVPIVGRIPRELLAGGKTDGDKTGGGKTDDGVGPETAPDLGGMVVVVVEDDDGPRETLRETLVEWGCYVLDGESAEEVIEKLRSDGVAPDFLISDYRLPNGITGISVIARIWQEVKSQVPAAIWTAETSTVILEEIARAGFDHIRKPPEETALIALLYSHRPQMVNEIAGPG